MHIAGAPRAMNTAAEGMRSATTAVAPAFTPISVPAAA
ncbi:hypothetical protein PC116_g34023 [Phytophthora cactorum]|nr:hypothetical protein PC116_g34023 [Phytophthora cactorum]